MLEKLFEKKVELGLMIYQGSQESQKGRGKVPSGEEGVARTEKCHFSAYRVKVVKALFIIYFE